MIVAIIVARFGGAEKNDCNGAGTNCARPATEYSNARKNFFDYPAKWINEPFQ
jgi:hypothetical protein